jgi:enoyl-CoA hydratase
MSIAETGEVVFTVEGAAGIVTLNRPKALNALNRDMCAAIDGALIGWAQDDKIAAVIVRSASERAFCAGGDVRAVHDDGIAWKQGKGEGRILREMFRNEYRMNRRIKTFPKPYIALIDGITMGGGAGLAIHGSHIAATERTLFAMPETGIGLFPDIGASFVLPRLAGEAGTYLALTGARIEAPDLMDLGLATHAVASCDIPHIIADIVEQGGARQQIEAILLRYATPREAGTLTPHRPVIDRCFAYDRVEDILAALDSDGGVFAAATAATIRTMSPTSLKVTLMEMRRGRAMDFDDCMRMEYRLSQSILSGHDFYEGIRAQLIDKDRNPKWRPASLDAIDDAAIDRYLLPPQGGDLIFTD